MYRTSRLHARQAEGRASAGQGGVDGCSNRSCGLPDCPSAGRSARGCSSRRAVLHTAKSLPRRHCSLRHCSTAHTFCSWSCHVQVMREDDGAPQLGSDAPQHFFHIA